MCNWSEAIKEISYKEGMEEGMKEGMKEGMEKGVEKERLNAIERMIKANLTKAQIVSCGYIEEEFARAKGLLCVNA